MMNNYLRESDVNVKDGTDVNAIMKDMISIILECALDTEMDENLLILSMITGIRIQTTAGMVTLP